MQKNGSKDKQLKFTGILFWILIWAVIALLVNQKLVLAGPVDVLSSLYTSITTPSFWLSILFSFVHIFAGFCIAIIIGITLALLSTRVKIFHYFINPIIQLFKSAPIVCFIVLLLIWFGTYSVDIVTVVISVIPIYYYAIFQAGQEKSKAIMDALHIFRVKNLDKFRAYIWPNAFPYVEQATETGVGIAWKAGVTAQMIGAVANTIGEGIYNSKINLDSSQLIAWMFVVIILGYVTEKITIWLLKKSAIQNTKKSKFIENREIAEINACLDIVIKNLNISYNGREIINNFSYRFCAGKRYAIMGPIGCGKTTLINAVLGAGNGKNEIHFVDGAGIRKSYLPEAQRVFSVVYQETTLLPYINVEENLNIVGAGAIFANNKLPKFLPDSKLKPDELSGGMKRCTEIVRAVECQSRVVIMDEPFAGLDEDVKKEAIDYIQKNLGDRTLIIVTHDIEDAHQLGCRVINM